jgi:sporulation protein YlmC with PRC-barrel domain
MNKAVLIAAALVLAPVASWSQEATDKKDREPALAGKSSEQTGPGERSDELSQSGIRERVAQAIQTIEAACAADLDEFCSTVTSGEGRVAKCMLAHEDQLSSGCRSALSRVAIRLRRNVDRVAEACWSEIQAQCGDEGKIAQCLERKRSSLSSACQTIVGALEQRSRGRAALMGMAVFSSDGKNLGQVVSVMRDPDGQLQSVQVDIGRMLGLGSKVVTIPAEKLEQLPRIRAQLSDTEVRSLPEAKKP